MKKNRLFAFVMACTCMVLLAVPAFASTATIMASDQISSYSMTVTPGTGKFTIEFAITGKGNMKKIGCQSIYVYKQVGTSWSLTEKRLEDDTGMSKTDIYAHANTMYAAATAGIDYKVVVTVFAENQGRDSRTQTFYVTGQ